jgi:HlyD family secretion protein
MRRIFQHSAKLATTGLLAVILAACGAATAAPATTNVPATRLAVTATLPAAPTTAPAEAPVARTQLIATGEVQTEREVELAFLASGQVAQVLVQEGARVEAGQVIAVLDVRPLDAQVLQAEAALAAAKAQAASLSDGPRAADVRAAQAQVRQAEITLAQAQNGQTQDIRTAEATLAAAQVQEQEARNRLSRAKTTAEAAERNAVQLLVQAQAAYAKAKSDWEYVKSTGDDPQQPKLQTPEGEEVDNELEDSQREAYYAAFVQAEAALRQAELAVEQATVDTGEARKAELTGIRAAELQVIQAQAALDRLNVAEGESQVALAQVGVDLARAQRAQLDPAPQAGQVDQAAAGVSQAEAALAQAQLNRSYAELRAPFAGVIAANTLEPGQIVAAGGSAVRLVDAAALRFEAPVADFEVARLVEGQDVEVRIDGLPARVFAGRITYIAPTAEVEGGVRTFAVRVALKDASGVRIGMSGRMALTQP